MFSTPTANYSLPKTSSCKRVPIRPEPPWARFEHWVADGDLGFQSFSWEHNHV